MKKFLIKSSFFFVPFLVIYILNIVVYNQNEGDLVRLGYLYFNPYPKSKIDAQFPIEKKQTNISELNFNVKSKFDVVVIGDSFSGLGDLGYPNYLANDNISVLNFDFYIAKIDPLQTLIQLINSDFFEKVETDFVVLQSVERFIVQRCDSLKFEESITFDSIGRLPKPISNKHNNLNFFSDGTIKIPLSNLEYVFFDKSSFFKDTYEVKSNSYELFSGDTDDILFFYQDIINLEDKNDLYKIEYCNNILNKINDLLLSKGIDLIVLIAPDKYDLYYPYINNKEDYIKPLFFSYYNTLPKKYNYVNAYEILSLELEKQKDIYYYDDTHWSPIAASIIAQELKKMIENN